jgi:hypothetical protein
MPVTWKISDDLIWLQSGEEASFQEWRQAIEAAFEDPVYRPGMGVIHDWRRLRTPPSPDEIHMRAAYVAELDTRRWALVVRDDVGYGMGRMAEIVTSIPPLKASALPFEVRVFRDLTEAEAWARGLSEEED